MGQFHLCVTCKSFTKFGSGAPINLEGISVNMFVGFFNGSAMSPTLTAEMKLMFVGSLRDLSNFCSLSNKAWTIQ